MNDKLKKVNAKGKRQSSEEKIHEAQVTAVKDFLATGPIRRKLYSVTEIYNVYIFNEHGYLPTEFEDIAVDIANLCRFLRDLIESDQNLNEDA